MKVVILCGGMGTRLSEETQRRPKPMVEVGGHPLLWHLMKYYAHSGYRDFVLALGYKGDVIKQYFLNYSALNSDMEISLGSGTVRYLEALMEEDWTIRLHDTGLHTMTGGRLRRLEPILREEGTFMLTYGDGLSSVNVDDLLGFHRRSGRLATVTAVRPPARFGNMALDGDWVTEFKEKPQTEAGWINGGFFVFEPGVFDYLSCDQSVLEGEPLERLAADGQLSAYRHEGGWQCMDTLRDKHLLEGLWEAENAFWRIW